MRRSRCGDPLADRGADALAARSRRWHAGGCRFRRARSAGPPCRECPVRVLVTGNLGYIGPVLAKALTQAGHEVHGYDSALFASFATHSLPVVAHQAFADLRDTKALRRAVAQCDAVILLAAMSNDPSIELAGDRPLVVYSSASVYGVSAAMCGEDAPLRPLTLYSELKVAVEEVALKRANALVLRNGTVHGPAPVLRGDLLLNAMVASAVATGEIVLTTTPATSRPVIDVRDLAALTVGLLERGVTGLYNSAARNISVGQAADLVARFTAAGIVEQPHGSDPRDYAMDTSKLSRMVGSWWHPRPLEASVDDLIAHYRESRLSAGDVVTRRYHRIVQYRLRASREAASAK
ncbi:MAG: NAD(P)-dependent oxidoreductase [Chloroflexi bacterium]|nr:MAG: NAD(P)-dependent oxidoreductase [Chloroflexota bacterium]